MSPILLFDLRQTIREQVRDGRDLDRKATRERSRPGARCASLLVPQLVYERHRWASAPLRPTRQNRNPIAQPRRALRFESDSGQIREDAAGGRGAACGDLLGSLQNVVVDLEGRSHWLIITHQSSDVNVDGLWRASH